MLFCLFCVRAVDSQQYDSRSSRVYILFSYAFTVPIQTIQAIFLWPGMEKKPFWLYGYLFWFCVVLIFLCVVEE